MASSAFRWRLFLAATAVAAVAGMLVVPQTMPWEWLSARYDEVDIQSGRIRERKTLFGITVSEQVRETWVSHAIEPLGPADWRRVNTFAFGQGHSPHHRFHGAIGQIQFVEMLDEMQPFEAVDCPRVASELLRCWQNSDSDDDARRYLEGLSRVAQLN